MWNRHRQAGKQADAACRVSSATWPSTHRYAPRAPYTKEKGPSYRAAPCRVASRRAALPPLSLGRLKFNSGTAARRAVARSTLRSSLARSLLPSLATGRYRTFDLRRVARSKIFRLDDFVREKHSNFAGKIAAPMRGSQGNINILIIIIRS